MVSGGSVVFRKLDPLAELIFDCGGDFHNYLLAEIPRYLQIFLKFCHIHSVEISPNFVYASCYILRIYFGCKSKTSILSVDKLHNSGNYLQQNAKVRTQSRG